MSAIDSLIAELSEQAILNNASRKYDDARIQYTLPSITVRDFDEFTEIVGNYVQHTYSACMSHGGWISTADAAGIGKEILNNSGGRRGADVMTYYMDSKEGINGGLLQCLNTLCEGLKRQAVERYTRDVFDRYLPQDNKDLLEHMVVEFIQRYDKLLPGIDRTRPHWYARNLETLIRAMLHATEDMASIYRRL